ncbi:MAG TPA: class I SAM-dependent methyltransferase [Capillimicrobium sp.]|nr:class I SAM-dependent methyltransferase [Capillimicrobium sp.]
MLNWLARYAPLRDTLLDERGRARSSILDVGCGPHGLACAFPDVPFVGTDVLFPHRVAPTMTAVRSRPGPLPFADASFGTVLCLDVLEHIPGPERAGFVAELARVAADRVILACPTSEAQAIDDFLRAQLGEPMPTWLAEHYACGLPTPAEVAACACGVDGFTGTEIGTANGLLAVMAAVADSLPPFDAVARAEAHAHAPEWIELFAAARFGTSPRKIWLIERIEQREPLVPHDAPAGAVAAALRCPDCGGDHRDLRCTGCGRQVVQDATGALDLATPAAPATETAPAGLDTDAATVLWLAPQAGRPARWVSALHAYIAATTPADDTCLVLDVSADPAMADVVAQACADLAGTSPFGDVLLVADAVARPPHADVVEDAEGVARALGRVAHPGPAAA